MIESFGHILLWYFGLVYGAMAAILILALALFVFASFALLLSVALLKLADYLDMRF